VYRAEVTDILGIADIADVSDIVDIADIASGYREYCEYCEYCGYCSIVIGLWLLSWWKRVVVCKVSWGGPVTALDQLTPKALDINYILKVYKLITFSYKIN